MSSRYSISVSASVLEKRFEIEVSPAYKPRFNAAPAQLLPVVTNTGPQGLSFFYWGLAPKWAKNKTISEKIIQTRTESIEEKPLLKKALTKQRCLIPADGIYLWKKVGKKTLIPHRVTLRDTELFAMAGLWEEYDDENGELFHTFTLITTQANSLVSSFDERMPVIIKRALEKSWLSNEISQEQLLKSLTPYPSEQMDCFTISSRINALLNDDALLILPAPPSDQFGNFTLFD
jgi:putative SOS response-associated peptidase YedK